MIRLTLILPLALVAACSQEVEPLSLPAPVEPGTTPGAATNTTPEPS